MTQSQNSTQSAVPQNLPDQSSKLESALSEPVKNPDVLPIGLHPTIYRVASALRNRGNNDTLALLRMLQVISEYNKHNAFDFSDREPETFDKFVARCDLPPAHDYTLDQTDPNNPVWVKADMTSWMLGYAPGFDTVIPATLEVQAYETSKKPGRPAKKYMIRGQMRTLSDAARVLGVSRQTLYARLADGRPLDGGTVSPVPTVTTLRDAPPYQQRYSAPPAPEPENRSIEDLPHWHSYGHPECLTNAQRKLILATDPTFRDNPWMLWPEGQVPEEFGPEPERLKLAREAAAYTGKHMLLTREIDEFPPAVPIEPWR